MNIVLNINVAAYTKETRQWYYNRERYLFDVINHMSDNEEKGKKKKLRLHILHLLKVRGRGRGRKEQDTVAIANDLRT